MKKTYTEQYIKIEIKGPLSIVTGEKLEVPADKASKISELHKYLIDNYMDKAAKEGLREVLERLDSQNLILVNGREISALKGIDTEINPGDEIVILNYTHGG